MGYGKKIAAHSASVKPVIHNGFNLSWKFGLLSTEAKPKSFSGWSEIIISTNTFKDNFWCLGKIKEGLF